MSRILFMGTPDFAVPSLKRLYEDGHEIVGVLCQPDKPKGRGMKLVFPPVKQAALDLGLAVDQPTVLKDNALQSLLEEKRPDLIAVVAYGRLLPPYVLQYPRLGCVNLHGSLLPKYRGAAPIQRSVLAGDRTVGVTTMFMAEKLDAGDMILQYETELLPGETSGELHDRLMVAGADLLSKTVALLETGEAPRIPQREADATYAPMLLKEEGLVDWREGPEALCRKILGLNPWPTAYTSLKGQPLKLYRAFPAEEKTEKEPGTALSVVRGKGLLVACGGGRGLYVSELQAAGGKRMGAEEYFRGHPELLGAVLGQ